MEPSGESPTLAWWEWKGAGLLEQFQQEASSALLQTKWETTTGKLPTQIMLQAVFSRVNHHGCPFDF